MVPNGVVDPGEECDDSDPAAPAGCNQCILCGNGTTTTPQEDCDDGNLNCGDGCSNTCRNEVCGDNVVTCNETCDDGNRSDNDACPGDCVIDSCTPAAGSSQLVTVNFASTQSVAAILVFVDYPEGKVSIPGSGNAPTVTSRILELPSSTTSAPNDLDHAMRAFVSKSTPFTTIPAGRLFRVDFQTCQGSPAPVSGEFPCTVLSASNQLGTDVTAATTCSVTVP